MVGEKLEGTENMIIMKDLVDHKQNPVGNTRVPYIVQGTTFIS